MSVMERECQQYEAQWLPSNPNNSWEWKTMSGSHYSYNAWNRSVYKHIGYHQELVLSNVTQMWFPERVMFYSGENFRPFFMAESATKGRSYFRSNLVTALTSQDWERRMLGDRKQLVSWSFLDEGVWVDKEVVMAL